MDRKKTQRGNMIHKLPKIGLSALTVMMLSGCVKLGPDFMGIDTPPLPKNWTQGDNKVNSAAMAQWWKKFNDPTLNTLVQKTYAQNLDIKSAGLRIVQARAVLGISEGLTFPQVQTLSGSATRTSNRSISSNRTGYATVTFTTL
jgi:outer membrane protein TolC